MSEAYSTAITRSELQKLAQTVLHANGIELGMDPRNEIQVAMDFGLLSLTGEILAVAEVTPDATAGVYYKQ